MGKSIIQRRLPLGFPWQTQDPFLFCVFHEDFYPRGNGELGPATSLKGRSLGQDFTVKDGFRMYHGLRVPGFPAHPHRGFETITVVNRGLVDHCDSMGSGGRYGDGDVQWMTAGSGVQHSEMFPLLNVDGDNPFELFQIWLNLPRASKMVDPCYTMMWDEDIPVVQHVDDNEHMTSIKVIAGRLGDVHALSPAPNSWAADGHNDVAIMTIDLSSRAEWTLPATAEGVHRSLFFFSGSELTIGDETVNEHLAFELEPRLTRFKNGPHPSRLLLLQGRPIGEPVAQQGPFVMNEHTELQQAFEDFHRTEFGGWPWPVRDQTHPKKRGRFARYPNGREEVR